LWPIKTPQLVWLFGLQLNELFYFCFMENEELKTRIGSLGDTELIELLKLRDSYQPEAVDFAIQEALRRQIIQSEADLQSAGFQPEHRYQKSIFPHLNPDNQFQKVFNSFMRILYLTAVAPLVFGVLNLLDGDHRGALLLLGLGLLWVGLSVRLQKQKNPQIPVVLLVLFLLGLTRVFFTQINFAALQIMDFVVFGIAFLLFIYVLVYLRVLLMRRTSGGSTSD